MPLNINVYLILLSKYHGDIKLATEKEKKVASKANGRHAFLAYRLAIKQYNKLPHEENNSSNIQVITISMEQLTRRKVNMDTMPSSHQ